MVCMGLAILFAWGAVLVLSVGSAALVYTMLHPKRKTYAHALACGVPGDPGEMGWAAREISYDFPDGTSSPAWLIEGENPVGPVVVFIHGWSSSRVMALSRIAPVVKDASQVVVYDLRGHGESTAPRCHMAKTEVDDLLTIINQIECRDEMGAGKRPLVLFGISMGAVIAIGAASCDTKCQIAGVIAESPYRTVIEPIVGHLRRRGLVPYPFAWIGWLAVACFRGDRRAFDRVMRAARVNAPLLVLHGTLDPLSRFESGQKIAHAAGAGTFVPFEGGGHGDLVSVDSRKYFKAIRGFLVDLTSRNMSSVCADTIQESVACEPVAPI